MIQILHRGQNSSPSSIQAYLDHHSNGVSPATSDSKLHDLTHDVIVLNSLDLHVVLDIRGYIFRALAQPAATAHRQ